MEGHGRHLERQARHQEHDADDDADRGSLPCRCLEDRGQRLEIGGAGETVDDRAAVEQHPRRKRTQDEILETGFGRTQRIAAECRQHIERQALQFDPQIERDQVVGRDHHHHAERGQQHEDGKLGTLHLLVTQITVRHHQTERRPRQHQDFCEHTEPIGHEHSGEGDGAAFRSRQHQYEGNAEPQYRQPRHAAAGAIAAENAPHQQHHRPHCEPDFRQRRGEVGDLGDGQGRAHESVTAPPLPASARLPAPRCAVRSSFRR